MKPVLTAFHKERDFSAAEEINKTIFLALTCESTSKPRGLDCHANSDRTTAFLPQSSQHGLHSAKTV